MAPRPNNPKASPSRTHSTRSSKIATEEISLATLLESIETYDRFATKEDLDTAFSTLGDRIAIAKESLQEETSGLKYAKQIDELRARVNVLESKRGIKPTHRAA